MNLLRQLLEAKIVDRGDLDPACIDNMVVRLTFRVTMVMVMA